MTRAEKIVKRHTSRVRGGRQAAERARRAKEARTRAGRKS